MFSSGFPDISVHLDSLMSAALIVSTSFQCRSQRTVFSLSLEGEYHVLQWTAYQMGSFSDNVPHGGLGMGSALLVHHLGNAMSIFYCKISVANFYYQQSFWPHSVSIFFFFHDLSYPLEMGVTWKGGGGGGGGGSHTHFPCP